MGKRRLPDREEVTDEGQWVSSNPNKYEFKSPRQPCDPNLSQEESGEEIK